MGLDKKDKKKEETPQEEQEEQEDSMEEVVKFVDSLPANVRRRVFALYSIQKDYTEQHEKYSQELRELEQKYEQLFLPFYDRRKIIVDGTSEPTEEEVSVGSKIVEVSEEGKEAEKSDSQKQQKKEEASSTGIPNFWQTAMKNSDVIQEIITQRDEDCLQFLTDVSCKNFDDPSKGFTLTFAFKSNPYFSNTVLTKKYFLEDDDEIVLEKAEGCKIEWLADKNLTVEIKQKKQKHKGSKGVRTVTTVEPCDSFFNFFSPPNMPEDEDAEEKDEDELDELENKIEIDYEIGRTFKEKLIPKAVDWYTGEAVPPLQFPMDDGMNEVDFDDDDDDDDEAPAARKRVKDKSGKQKSSEPQQNQQQECKQQ